MQQKLQNPNPNRTPVKTTRLFRSSHPESKIQQGRISSGRVSLLFLNSLNFPNALHSAPSSHLISRVFAALQAHIIYCCPPIIPWLDCRRCCSLFCACTCICCWPGCCLDMTRISKASTRLFSAAFSLTRYRFRFSRCAMYSVALERTVALNLG